MKEFFKKNYVLFFVGFFVTLCVIAMLSTEDAVYNPALEHGNETIHPIRIESVDEGTDVYTLHMSNLGTHNHKLALSTT